MQDPTPKPYVVVAVPPRDATDEEVRAWAEAFIQRMRDRANEIERSDNG